MWTGFVCCRIHAVRCSPSFARGRAIQSSTRASYFRWKNISNNNIHCTRNNIHSARALSSATTLILLSEKVPPMIPEIHTVIRSTFWDRKEFANRTEAILIWRHWLRHVIALRTPAALCSRLVKSFSTVHDSALVKHLSFTWLLQPGLEWITSWHETVTDYWYFQTHTDRSILTLEGIVWGSFAWLCIKHIM